MSDRREGVIQTTQGLLKAQLGAVTVHALIVRLEYLTRPQGEGVRDVHERMGADGEYLACWRHWCAIVHSRTIPIGEATRQDLYRIAVFVLGQITEHRTKPSDVQWYPDEWEDAAALIRGEVRRVEGYDLSDEQSRERLKQQVELLQREERAAS